MTETEIAEDLRAEGCTRRTREKLAAEIVVSAEEGKSRLLARKRLRISENLRRGEHELCRIDYRAYKFRKER